MNFLTDAEVKDGAVAAQARTDEVLPWPEFHRGTDSAKEALNRHKFETFCLATNRFMASEFYLDPKTGQYGANTMKLYKLWLAR